MPEPATDEVTLVKRTPPPVAYRGRSNTYPYDQAYEMLMASPDQWISLRIGPSMRMNKFQSRFRETVSKALPYPWAIEVTVRKITEEGSAQPKSEVFARVYQDDFLAPEENTHPEEESQHGEGR